MSSTKEKKTPFVIGAGLGRTGTSSLHAALNQLGYNTMHIEDVMASRNPHAWFQWADAKRKKDPKADELAKVVVKQIIDEGYSGTSDFPACLLYKELMEAIPDAKVILSVRSSGEAWADSVLSTIGAVGHMQYTRAPEMFKMNKFLSTIYPYL